MKPEDVLRGLAAIATGGATEAAIAAAQAIEAEARRAAEAAAEEARRIQAAVGQGAAGPPGTVPSESSAAGRECGPTGERLTEAVKTPGAGAAPMADPACARRYELTPPFLLDIVSGRVWRFDDASASFHVVPRESTELERKVQQFAYAKIQTSFGGSLSLNEARMSREEFEVLAPAAEALRETLANASGGTIAQKQPGGSIAQKQPGGDIAVKQSGAVKQPGSKRPAAKRPD